MRNILLVHKFTSSSPLPLPASSVFCAGESGCLFGCIGIGNGDGEEVNGDNSNEQFLSNLVRISEFNHIEELVKSNLLQDTFLMQFIPSTECLYAATLRGAFLQYYLNNEVEELFQSEAGISNFSVSPDSRLVTIITSVGGLLLLSMPALEMIVQEELLQSTSVEPGNNDVTLCWRHDSRFFVVNYPSGEGDERKLRIYDESGVFFATTESSALIMNQILAWQKSGALIATLERPPPGKQDCTVSFYELNGLKRSEFNPFEGRNVQDRGPILSLSWNTASDILALRKKNKVELWYRSNYVWMCKRSIATSRKSEEKKKLDDIKFFTWDSESPYKIYIVFESGFYSAYELKFGYSSAKSGGSCITASVSGNTIYYTPFRDNCAPPPYGFRQVSFESVLKEVVVSSFWNGFLAILSSGKVLLVKNGQDGPEILRTIKSDDDGRFRSAYGWIWPNSLTLCGIKEGKLLIWVLPPDLYETNANYASDSTINLRTSLSINCLTLTSVEWECEEAAHILIQKTGGSLVLLNLASLEAELLLRIPPNCFTTIQYLYPRRNAGIGKEDLKSNLIVIAHEPHTRKLEAFLSPNLSFQLATDCTSIETFEDYLLFTTIQGSLEIIHVNDVHNALLSKNPTTTIVEKYTRKIEKGSVTVSCCWNRGFEPSLVLQVLPRGNLETIFPRPLVIASLRIILRKESNRSYGTIMTAMRRHRINANVLIDELKKIEAEGTQKLTINQAINSLVEDVQDPNLLVLFVTELSTENLETVESMRRILEKLTTSLETRENYAQPFLAAMAKLGLYEQALNSPLIAEEKDRERVKSHIKFLSFYSENPEVLYEAALGTYDLNLTAVVADCLNRDPKEYLPILNDLQSLSPEKRCFSIDNTLKKYSKAVKSLLVDTTVQHDELLKFVERHRLYSSTLKIIQEASDEETKPRGAEDIKVLKREIQILYGRSLENSGKLREASILYRRGGNVAKALDCCTKSASWEAALSICYEENFQQEAFSELCNNLLVVLEDREDFEGAARLCELHLKNSQRAIEFWVRGKRWLSAYSLATRTSESELTKPMTEFIKLKLIEQSGYLEGFLQKTARETENYVKRLRAVKTLKAEKEQAAEDGTGENFSDTESVSTTSSIRSGSMTSSMTGKTRQSSKNKRKAERKIFSLKEGSRFEDIAITVQIWDILSRLHQEVKRDMAYTIESLWRFELDAMATALTASFDEVIRKADEFMKEIWSSPLPENPMLDSKYRVIPAGWTASWDKLSFATSLNPL